MSRSAHREQVEDDHHQNEEYHWAHLSEKVSAIELLTAIVLVSVLLSLAIPIGNVTEKHVVEKLFCVGEFGVEVTPTVPIPVLRLIATAPTVLLLLCVASNAAKLVVKSALGLVTKSHHCVVDALECLLGLRRRVLIWMEF